MCWGEGTALQETGRQQGTGHAGLVGSEEEFGFHFKYSGDSLMSCIQGLSFDGGYTIIVPAVETGSWRERGKNGTRDPVRLLE